ncbi:MAG: hypothetical protein CVU45_08970 [Chloroflexi bacterium HGW-Chloroflexi-7]|nr:MAG: hypothetical protein CVU45_08970 [Chloroflexi bacterium HGW-Chloroflexi-7]
MPILSDKIKEILIGQEPTEAAFKEVGVAVQSEIDPASDLNGTAEYRRDLIRVLVPRSLALSLERAKKGS